MNFLEMLLFIGIGIGISEVGMSVWLKKRPSIRKITRETISSSSHDVQIDVSNLHKSPTEIQEEIYKFQEDHLMALLDKDRVSLASPLREIVALFRLRLHLMNGPGHDSTLLDAPSHQLFSDILKALNDFSLPDLAATFQQAKTITEDWPLELRNSDFQEARAGTLVDRSNRPHKDYIRNELNRRNGNQRLSVVLTKYILATYGPAGATAEIKQHANESIAPPPPRKPYLVTDKRPLAPYFQKARDIASPNFEKFLASELSISDLNILRLAELIAAIQGRNVEHFADTSLDDILITQTCKLLEENEAVDMAALFQEIMHVWQSYLLNKIGLSEQEDRFEKLFDDVDEAGGLERVYKIADQYAYSQYPWTDMT